MISGQFRIEAPVNDDRILQAAGQKRKDRASDKELRCFEQVPTAIALWASYQTGEWQPPG